MSSFESTRNMRNQRHFEVLEIDLPVIMGACTIGSVAGTGTPLTCDQVWDAATDGFKTYYFTNTDAPILPSINGEPIYRLIESINVSSAELMPSKGLGSRSTMSITMIDVNKQDPNIGAAGITAEVKAQGTYLGKLSERQIVENKTARLKHYRVQSDGTVDLAGGAETLHFLCDTLAPSSSDKWQFKFKDLLSVVNLGDQEWPQSKGGFLSFDVDNLTPTIRVDQFVDWSNVEVVRVGEEHMRVLSVAGNLSTSAALTVATRGQPITGTVSGETLTHTNAESHSAGDEVFYCSVSDNETIDSLLTSVLTDSDLPSALIPSSDWAAEVATWHASDKINTIHSESESVTKVINRILNGFLMDSWFSPVENEARLSAISVWKQSTAVLKEGREIIAHSMKKVAKEQLRASRALVLYDKKNLSDSDDIKSFKKGAQFHDSTIIGPALFSKHKDKRFDNNHLLDTASAKLLTQRHVSRFKMTPYERSWSTDERYMTFKVGDVVDIESSIDQDIYGAQNSNVRGQITRINTKYKGGRTYDVKALTYEAAALSGSEFVIDSPSQALDLYGYAGNPVEAVDLIFVFKGSYSFGNLAITTGAFVTGSTIKIIMVDGFDGQANGGRGATGQGIEWDGESSTLLTFAIQNGFGGGTVFRGSAGVTIDFYFSGATGVASYPTADGYIRAPSGGAGGFNKTGSGVSATSGDGGDAGDGRNAGVGGAFGISEGAPNLGSGITGSNGSIDGSGTGWGLAGANNDSAGGASGSGIVANGAIITLHADGDIATRYINGNGTE